MALGPAGWPPIGAGSRLNGVVPPRSAAAPAIVPLRKLRPFLPSRSARSDRRRAEVASEGVQSTPSWLRWQPGGPSQTHIFTDCRSRPVLRSVPASGMASIAHQ